MRKIGLIAGNRRFPLIFAQQARDKGYRIVVAAIKGNTSRSINRYAHKVYWIDIREFSKVFEIFRQEQINSVAMAGQVNPGYLFDKKIMEDDEVKGLFSELEDNRANTIFGLIAERLNKQGFELLSSTTFMEEFLPDKGVLTQHQPDPIMWQDVNFGLDLARQVAHLDIGQTVAIKNKAIVAVEALEGTDSLIRRTGKIVRQGAIIIKVSRPNQDMRFDIPLVGLSTVKNLINIRAVCLAVEAKKTIFIDREAGVKLADRYALSIVAV